LVLQLDYLTVARGEILAIVGPSGAGKSTLLRLLNFLESPDIGQIVFAGIPFPPTPPVTVSRQVVTVFQRPILLDRRVRDVVAYGLTLRGLRDDRKVFEMLGEVGLTSLAGINARALSGGEAQRVALAQALVIEPTALLLDEPTANLDPANVALIEQLVRTRNASQGTTVILVTHNIFQARRLAHRTAFLLDGRLVEVAPTEQLFTNPANPRTAAFLRGDLIY
jgi:tungstate transport system ATP-binding protein